jgi:hypothetical protein
MAKVTYHRLYVATRQLETAVAFFLSGRDYYSAITLAGAASGILSQLVMNQGHENFLDYSRRVYNVFSGFTPPRKKFEKHIKDRMGINALKHHSPTDPPSIDLDVELAAEQAVTRAVVDYIELKGQQDPFVIAFLNRLWQKNGPELMAAYKHQPDAVLKKSPKKK